MMALRKYAQPLPVRLTADALDSLRSVLREGERLADAIRDAVDLLIAQRRAAAHNQE